MLNHRLKSVPPLQGLWNLTWIVGSIDELFAAGRWPTNDNCPGSGRVQRWPRRAGESFEGYFGVVVPGNDTKKGDANIILHGQLKRVASFAVGRQLCWVRGDTSGFNAATY